MFTKWEWDRCPSQALRLPLGVPPMLVKHRAGMFWITKLVPITGSGWGGATKARRVCLLVLPGGHTCSPFEEGILHLWIGGLVVPIGLGVKEAGSREGVGTRIRPHT